MTDQNAPVVIVGGSAAGFYLARQLAREGVPVRVYEGAAVLDPDPRTLIVTDRFREQMGELAEGAILNEIRTFELCANGDRATVQLQRPDLIIERAHVIKVLAKAAQEAGAEVVTGHRFVGLASSGHGSTTDSGGGAIGLDFERSGSNGAERLKVSADVVVGADGAFSTVARQAGWPQQPTVPLVQAIVDLPEDFPPHTTRVWFVPEDTPYFYWLIPESPTRGALGVIGEDGAKIRPRLERFAAKQGLEPLEFQAGRIPCYVKWIPVRREVGGSAVYLVGDAAGQVKVTTVGGIVTGFRGAQGVAEAILDSGKSWEVGRLRRELDLHLLIRRAMHGFQAADYDRLLALLGDPARRSLGRFNRDETARLMRDLLLKQPRLLFLGLRSLVSNWKFGG